MALLQVVVTGRLSQRWLCSCLVSADKSLSWGSSHGACQMLSTGVLLRLFMPLLVIGRALICRSCVSLGELPTCLLHPFPSPDVPAISPAGWSSTGLPTVLIEMGCSVTLPCVCVAGTRWRLLVGTWSPYTSCTPCATQDWSRQEQRTCSTSPAMIDGEQLLCLGCSLQLASSWQHTADHSCGVAEVEPKPLCSCQTLECMGATDTVSVLKATTTA